MTDPGRRRSTEWFDRSDIRGFIHRAFMKASGFTPEDMGRPVIGIAQTWSELNHCNSHLRAVAEAVKRGVWQVGGWPLEFPTISLGEIMVKPTTMLYRNPGHCMVRGTASTMTSIAEALGMTLPGCAAIPAPDSRRLRLAEASGRRIVEMAREGLRPSQILTSKALENAIRVSM